MPNQSDIYKKNLKGWIQIYIDKIYHPTSEYCCKEKLFWHVKVFGKTIIQIEIKDK